MCEFINVLAKVLFWFGSFAFVIWMYRSVLDEFADGFIYDNRKEIDDFLKYQNLILYEGRTWQDMSPCQMTYGLRYAHDDNATHQLAPRKIKWLIVKLKRNEITAEYARNYVRDHGELIKQPTSWESA